MRKNTIWIAALFMVMMVFGTIPVLAASGAPKVESWEYKGKNKIEIDFKGKVKYNNPKVEVKDSDGTNYAAVITEKDNDDITFKVKKLKKGRSYNYTISGIKKKNAGNFTEVKGKFRIAGNSEIMIEDVDYDKNDKEVTFEFQGAVKWKNVKVTITDSKGTNYVKRIADKDRDELEVKVKKLSSGKKYSYKISGIAKKGSGKYQTVTGSFRP